MHRLEELSKTANAIHVREIGFEFRRKRVGDENQTSLPFSKFASKLSSTLPRFTNLKVLEWMDEMQAIADDESINMIVTVLSALNLQNITKLGVELGDGWTERGTFSRVPTPIPEIPESLRLKGLKDLTIGGEWTSIKGGAIDSFFQLLVCDLKLESLEIWNCSVNRAAAGLESNSQNSCIKLQSLKSMMKEAEFQKLTLLPQF